MPIILCLTCMVCNTSLLAVLFSLCQIIHEVVKFGHMGLPKICVKKNTIQRTRIGFEIQKVFKHHLYPAREHHTCGTHVLMIPTTTLCHVQRQGNVFKSKTNQVWTLGILNHSYTPLQLHLPIHVGRCCDLDS